ncbi:hypothetical protein BC332_01509 [Capsicum chinense]|nr:hypothetical protein BC332_01509 [Capsicum chinense]
MAIKFNHIRWTLLVVVVTVLLHVSEECRDWEEGSDWKPITNITEEVTEIGKFAVEEHNKEAKTKLEFKEVMKGESKVDKGKNYYCLVISAKDGDLPHKYLVKVWVNPEEKSKNLTSFGECKIENGMGANCNLT